MKSGPPASLGGTLLIPAVHPLFQLSTHEGCHLEEGWCVSPGGSRLQPGEVCHAGPQQLGPSIPVEGTVGLERVLLEPLRLSQLAPSAG